jgi:outer membrane protein OmpA-like peptidoglycan-associated protein
VRVIDGSSGVPGSLRFQLGFDYFGASDFLEAKDTHRYTSGTLSVSATPIEHLEIFGAIASHASSNDSGNPILLQSAGDFSLGVKGYASVLPWLSVGADLRGMLLNPIGNVGLDGGSISAGLRVAATGDCRHLKSLQLPLIVRANVGYLLDNSSKLIEDTENARYNALPSSTRRPRADEDRHLVNRIERFGLGINRVDILGFGLGIEVPLRLAQDFFLQPLVEWTLGVPVNRQDFDCLSVPTDATNKSSDGCLAVDGLKAAPSTLTAGIRVLPPVRGLSALVGADIGLLGTSTFVREVAPTRPWALLISVAYAADTRAPKLPAHSAEPPPPMAAVHREPVPATPATLRVRGEVVERGTGKPVIGAVVRYPGQDFTPQLTSADGVFVSYQIPANASMLALEITHPDYESGHCLVQLSAAAASHPPAGVSAEPSASGLAPVAGNGEPPPSGLTVVQDNRPAARQEPSTSVGRMVNGMISARCELNALPQASSLLGTVTDPDGKALSGVPVELTGPVSSTLTSGAAGEIKADGLTPGEYTATVSAQDYLYKRVTFTVVGRNDTSLRLAVTPRPRKAQALLAAKEIKIGSAVVFRPSSAEIDTRSSVLLAEVADVLARNPTVRVEIQGHTDNSGDPAQNKVLSQQRAESVRSWLVNSGIEAGRLEAKGYGDEQPIVPNLTPESRARNRRVQFTLVK